MREIFKLDQLPDTVGMAVDKLLVDLTAAQSPAQIELEEVRQRGFVLGLETAKYLRPVDIEQLYLMFEEAVRARSNALDDA